MTIVMITTGWFKQPKDQIIVSKFSPTRRNPRRFEVWFARDTRQEAEAELDRRCKAGWIEEYAAVRRET